MKVAFFSTKSYDREYFDKYNHREKFQLNYFEPSLDEDTVKLTSGFDAVCIFVNDKITREVIKILKENGVKIIALRCAGFNNVDLKAAHEFDVKVVRVPAYSPNAVAEFALALILTLNRKTHKSFNRVREGNFSLERLTGFNLEKKTVGVIGTGKIGLAFCKIMKGFDCNVVAHDIHESSEVLSLGVKYQSLDLLLKDSDIISLHCPLTVDTRHMIDKRAFAKMKDGVMLINTSRGGLINTGDAISALKSRKVGYLGIDVYEQEEQLFFKDHSESIIDDDLIMRLISFPNVLITSHQAFFTKEALIQITTTTFENLTTFSEGKELKNEVKIS